MKQKLDAHPDRDLERGFQAASMFDCEGARSGMNAALHCRFTGKRADLLKLLKLEAKKKLLMRL